MCARSSPTACRRGSFYKGSRRCAPGNPARSCSIGASSPRLSRQPPSPRARRLPEFSGGKARLIGEREFKEPPLAERPQCRFVADLEGGEAAADHQRNLIEQHVADGAQLAAKAVALAQQ